MRIGRYIGQRLLLVLPVLLGVLVLSFFLVRVLPGDPVQQFVTPGMTDADIEALRVRLGLDSSLLVQFGEYLGGLFTGDLGTSIQSGAPIATELATRVAPTFQLVVLSVGVALVLALFLGIWSALRVDRPLDQVTRVSSLVGTAMPEFWFGLVLIVIGYQYLDLFPAPSGRIDPDLAPTPLTGAELIDGLLTLDMPAVGSALWHLALPMLTIVVGVSASLIRTVRAAALDILAAPAWQTARAHGVGGSTLLRGYLVRGTLARIPTLVVIVFGNVLGGVVLVETVFSWQGMGQWLLRGLLYRDYPVIQAGIAIIAVVYALAYLVADLAQAVLDPRVRL